MTLYEIGYESDSGTNPPLEQGSTFVLPFTCTNIFNSSDTADDLIIRAEYRPYPISSSTYTSFDECSITSVTSALVTGVVRMSATVSASISAGKGFWDCEIEDSTGFVLKPFGCGARCLVVAEATRSTL